MNKIYLCVIALLLVTSSCGDFLEEESQNLAYVHSTQDLNELLIGNGYLQKEKNGDPYRFVWLDVMDDDVTHRLSKPSVEGSSVMFNNMKEFYRWNSYPFNDDQPNLWAGPLGWEKFYGCIGIINVILGDVERFKDEKDYSRIKGEALFLRGFYYFYLVNIWGHPYNVASASTDLGVPIKLTDYIEDKGYRRNSVEECYQQIVKDVKEAIIYLEGVVQPSTRRANQNAARALLAKTYLYMGEYQLALEQCNAILNKPGDLMLIDLHTITPAAFATLQRKQTSSECIFTNSNGSPLFQTAHESVVASSGLLNCYDAANDLRFNTGKDSHFFKYLSGFYFGQVKSSTTNEVNSISLLFPEVYLNKAEALALLDRPTEAVETLQELRKKRMTDVGTIDLTGEKLVKFIRDERRRELCFTGQRWFDLKRYAVHPKYPQKTRIEHPYYEWTGSATLVKTYVLDEYPGDGGWLMPFPNSALISNEGALENNIRPER